MKYVAIVLAIFVWPSAASAFEQYAALSSAKRDKSELAKAMSLIMSAATPSLGAAVRERLIKDYEEGKPHKAQAVEPVGGGYWRAPLYEKQSVAGERTLEGCQMRYGKPCALIAVDDEISAEGELTPRDMPRLHYSGKFDLDQIPALRLAVRKRSDIQNYDYAMEPKAMAVHHWGRFFIAAGNPTSKEAAEAALATCNGDPTRNGVDGPCFLYALNNDVVLSQRLTAPK
jgi:hypothetical protein